MYAQTYIVLRLTSAVTKELSDKRIKYIASIVLKIDYT